MRALEKELRDNARLLAAWRRWHREQLQAALDGLHSAAVAQVMAFLKGMQPGSASALIALLREHDWSRMDTDVRLVVLHELNKSICKLREQAGLEPIDDPLPGQRANAFLLIKEHLFPRKAGSTPGTARQNSDMT